MSVNEQRLNDLYRTIAMSLAGELPERWSRAVIEAKLIDGLTELEAYYFESRDDANAHSVYAGDDADVAFEELRAAMAADNGERGTWYSARFQLSADGRYSVDYDYESKPAFSQEPPPDMFRADLARYPRAPELVPQWLRAK